LTDTQPVTVFTEKKASRLLEYMVWDHITEVTVDGKRKRGTWEK
jgi:hypothetical protein